MEFFGIESIDHKMERLRIQFKDTSKINHTKLIKLLSENNSDLIYSPDNNLVLKNVPADMTSIIKRLKKLEEVFY